MRILQLAFLNFRNSFKSYLSLVISLSFTILILYNFQNTIYSDAFAVLGQHNKEYINMLIQVVTIVLLCFMFFFIWYATNVFLTRRKREIGIYIFMGMTNQKIAMLYMIEISFVGITALVVGIGFGALFAGLFQMILGAVSETAIDVKFEIFPKAVAFTAVAFLILYLIFACKGYWNIVHSSVLGMISAARQNEYVHIKNSILLLKALVGIVLTTVGYYLANKGGRYKVMENLLLAVVLVIAGVYLLFGGLIPLIFQMLLRNKTFLYRGQRCLWMNQTIFRMRKNYRTYAMVCIMGICSTTALATGFAMKERYYNMIVFDNKYTFQLLTNQPNLEERAAELIQKETDIVYQTSLPVLSPDASHLVVSYTDIIRVTNESGVLFPLTEPLENETYYLSYQVLMSFILSKEVQPVTIGNDTFFQAGIVREPCLGYMQREMGCFYVVSDSTYSRMKEYSTILYIHNYKIADNAAFERARTAVDVLISNTDENFTARAAVDPFDNELEWIKVLHALCIFMFLVFIVAGGCIMFMKLYNDSFEERERYLVLKKLGFSTQTLTKSIAHELTSAYVLPLVVMAVSTYFSVHALGMVMYAELLSVYIVSILAVMIVFALCCIFSVSVYRRNVGLR